MLTVYQLLVPPCFQELPVFMVKGKSFDFGVCLFCPGGDGSMIRIERCSFTGNQAIGTQDNYGAADITCTFIFIGIGTRGLPNLLPSRLY